jgi:hypothetical protein
MIIPQVQPTVALLISFMAKAYIKWRRALPKVCIQTSSFQSVKKTVIYSR